MWRSIVASGIVMLSAVAAHAQATVLLCRIPDIPDQVIGGEILRVVYGRLGIAVEFVDAPAKRALVLSSSGAADGEVHRIAGLERDHPSLMQLSPAINYIEPAVFTTTLELEVRGWQSIAGYSIGIVRGVGSSEAGTRGMSDVTAADSLETLLRMLNAGRIDLLVTDLFSARVAARRMKLDSRIRAVLPPLERIYIYHYLHRRHRELARQVEGVIRDMDGSGELARLREALVQQMLRAP